MCCVVIRHDASMHLRGRIVTDRNATHGKRICVERGLNQTRTTKIYVDVSI